ncbi:hypothetical protein NUSPORA_00462 [Nucleospora cyclopteri]
MLKLKKEQIHLINIKDQKLYQIKKLAIFCVFLIFFLIVSLVIFDCLTQKRLLKKLGIQEKRTRKKIRKKDEPEKQYPKKEEPKLPRPDKDIDLEDEDLELSLQLQLMFECDEKKRRLQEKADFELAKQLQINLIILEEDKRKKRLIEEEKLTKEFLDNLQN